MCLWEEWKKAPNHERELFMICHFNDIRKELREEFVFDYLDSLYSRVNKSFYLWRNDMRYLISHKDNFNWDGK